MRVDLVIVVVERPPPSSRPDCLALGLTPPSSAGQTLTLPDHVMRSTRSLCAESAYHCPVSIAAMIKQFLTDVYWGEIDYLIIDTPPGTSDEHITVVENIRQHNPDGAVLVTTPQVWLIHSRTHWEFRPFSFTKTFAPLCSSPLPAVLTVLCLEFDAPTSEANFQLP